MLIMKSAYWLSVRVARPILLGCTSLAEVVITPAPPAILWQVVSQSFSFLKLTSSRQSIIFFTSQLHFLTWLTPGIHTSSHVSQGHVTAGVTSLFHEVRSQYGDSGVEFDEESDNTQHCRDILMKNTPILVFVPNSLGTPTFDRGQGNQNWMMSKYATFHQNLVVQMCNGKLGYGDRFCNDSYFNVNRLTLTVAVLGVG